MTMNEVDQLIDTILGRVKDCIYTVLTSVINDDPSSINQQEVIDIICLTAGNYIDGYYKGSHRSDPYMEIKLKNKKKSNFTVIKTNKE
jgi:hypothetical protein